MAGALNFVGGLFWVLGVWLLYVGFSMDPSVPVPGMEPVANLQLLQAQAVNLILGAAAIIEGTVLTVGAALVERLPKPPPSD